MDFKSWKRKNVTLRGISSDIRTTNSAGARFGDGLYTAFLSNRAMAKTYGDVYYVVGAIPKHPKTFNDANQAEIWVQNFMYDWCKKHLDNADRLDLREFYKNTDLATEMIKAGFDGLVIKGREMVNYKPNEDEIKYFSNDWQLEDYFETSVLNESASNFTEIFQKRWEAINDLEDQGIKNLKVNSDATLTLYHLTPKENVEKIKSNGFKSGSYFSITKKNSYKGDSSSIQAIQKFGDSAELMEIKVDPRFLEPINNNKDLYSKTSLILKDNVFSNQLNESFVEKITNNLLESEEKQYLQEFKNGRSILDYNYAYKNWYNVDLDKIDDYKRLKLIKLFLRKSEIQEKLVLLSCTKIRDIIYAEVSYTKNPTTLSQSELIPLDALYESKIVSNLLESDDPIIKFEQKYVDMFLLEQEIVEKYEKNSNYLNTNKFLMDRNKWEKMMKKHRGWTNHIFELGDHGSTNKEWIDFCDENGLDWKYNMDDVLA